MRKPLIVLAGFLMLAFGLSACEFSVVPVAARVGGSPISVSDLNSALNSANDDPGYLCYIEAQSQNETAVKGAGTDTFTSSFVSSQLGILASAKALHQAMVTAHIVTNSSIALSLANTQLTDLFTPQSGSGCTETAKQTINKLDPTYRDALLGFTSDEATLAAKYLKITLTDAGVKTYETQNPKTTSIDCVNAVLVATQAKANSVSSQLQKGANFAAVAKANSTDAPSAADGGRIGCLDPDELSAPLGPDVENLAVGTISPPIKFGTNWVILQVASRTFPAPAQAIFGAIETEIASKTYATAVSRLVGTEHIEVSPQYGSAKVVSGTVEITPVAGPKSQFLPNIAALSPA